MKKLYVKPMITVERLMIDQPMAVGCEADFDDVRALMEMGYFAEGCNIPVGEGTLPGHDTICYHSNIQKAFTS